MNHIRLKLIYWLLGKRLKDITIRALVQGSDIWFECVNDEAMQTNEDDRAVVEFVKKDVEELSEFWTL